MKTTKIVDIEICEQCGQETRPIKCNLCQREICDRCWVMFHTSVSCVTPQPPTAEGYAVTSVRRIYTKNNGTYCAECSVKVVTALRAVGLVESKDENYQFIQG